MIPLARSPRFQAIMPPVIVGLLVLGLWEFVCRGFSIPEYLFPAPSVIAASLWQNGPDLLRALWSTLRVTLSNNDALLAST